MAFGVGVIGLILIELANIYFIMPMPGSQRMRSIDEAYVIHSWRWPLRFFFGALVVAGVYFGDANAGMAQVAGSRSSSLVAFVAYAANYRWLPTTCSASRRC
jgi:hypothetical protein